MPTAPEVTVLSELAKGLDRASAVSYAERQATLAQMWAKAMGKTDEYSGMYIVAHDDRSVPGSAFHAAAATLRAVAGSPSLYRCVEKHIRTVVVHCARGVKPVDIRGTEIHFFKSNVDWDRDAESMIARELGRMVYDGLPKPERDAYADSCPKRRDCREDFATLFYAEACKKPNVLRPLKRADSPFRERLERVRMAIRHTSVLEQTAQSHEWTDDKNARRCELIDKEIEGTLTRQDRIELEDLQQQAIEHLDRVAPWPHEGARKLHQQLLAKKRRQEGQG